MSKRRPGQKRSVRRLRSGRRGCNKVRLRLVGTGQSLISGIGEANGEGSLAWKVRERKSEVKGEVGKT